MKKRLHILITALVLCLLIPFSSTVCVAAQEVEHTPFGMITVVPDAVTSPNVSSDPNFLRYQSFFEENSEVVSVLYEGIYTFQSKIDIRSYQLSANDITILMNLMFYSFPELFYISSYSYWYMGDTVIAVLPSYTVSNAEEKREQFYEVARTRYLPLIDDSMDDFTKAVILHDELALNTYYPDLSLKNEANNYTYLVEGWGVCQQYTECYAYLLALCGIKSEVIQSDPMGHAWLKVELDGSYYNVDVSWDDPVPDKTGKVKHRYFLYSDSKFQTADASINRERHYGYYTIHPSESTKYDNFDNLHSFSTQLCYLNGEFYAITDEGDLVRYNHYTDEITVITSLKYKWPAGGNRYWIGNFSSLIAFAEKLYYNSPDEIYQYDPETNETEVYAEITGEDKLYGLRVIDNQLWAVCTDSPNTGYITPVYLTDMPATTYQVIIDEAITGGTVTADNRSVEEGKTVTLTVTPDYDQYLVALTVNQTEIDPIDGVYSFVMPAEDVTVSAQFAQKPTFLRGDSDSDQEITIMDATAIQRVLVTMPTLTYDEEAADCDMDGEVTIVDATAIQRWLVGLPTEGKIGIWFSRKNFAAAA